MDFAYTEEQENLRKEIVRFARQKLNAGVEQRDQEHAFSHENWAAAGEMGLPGLPVPVEYGGLGLDPLTTAIALEAFGYGCEDSGLVFSVCAHLLACVVPIWKHGTEEQKQRWLPRLANGELIAVNCMSEPGSGSDAFSMTTRAVADGEGFRITGTKTFASNGPVADLALVFAMTDPEKGFSGGCTAFVVEKGAPGYQLGQTFHKMGLRTSPIGEMVFDDVYVGPENVIGGVGAGSGHFMAAMDWERICLFASHVGTLQRIMEHAIKYARTRKQFGQPIGKFQAVSHRIVDMKVSLEAARWLTYRSAWLLGNKKHVSMEASITKVFVSESLMKAALGNVQVLGGYGFMSEYPAERALRDAVGSTLYSGTNEIQRNIIASWLGL
ncbi:MAG: acyl-CoA dehydrogenase family protein [Candidatus Eisenbacteria bacterium]|nr:acyl-CoA dehydrogenase family protein [Candidatus Eisenbacteria bacterium]